MDEEIKKYEPSDDEYRFMNIDQKTGQLQVTKIGKRKRGDESFDLGGTQPSSRKSKH